ncbi:DUF4974 domain-containing protein [Wenyingzhuangia sp. chi5]|uniref:DUF4974 domain-containing protein n=1 Tax=Wenyingzhuangia gilva TaxID=3057677 RepID=A0ABT8VQQ5_9FLAO|nr:FecR family protein [Wenyingzhuangia sp. chi5]MDO3694301.1 DUF4974 domain-containing protein [Wenyingzhuangia sp. chi5]
MKFKILIKKLNNSLTKEEEIIFSEWYKSSKLHRDYFDRLKNNFEKELDFIDVEQGWILLNKKLNSKRVIKKYFNYGIAASIAILLSLVYVVFEKHNHPKVEIAVNKNQNKIFPGSDKAILTLANGANVALEKGNTHVLNHASSNGSEIIYTNKNKISQEVVYNYLTIPRGGQFVLQLSDGTKVWLNSETKLKYPVNFIKNKVREVELVYGEAYFDVSPSSEHNGAGFKVFQNNQEVSVLGTEFNIKAYKDETFIYTTLVEGKIFLQNNKSKQYLTPNEQAILNLNTQQLSIQSNIDTYNEASWKDGVFSFENKPLEEVMKVLSRWYDFEVIFENKEIQKEEFIGVLMKDRNIEDVLISIKSSGIINNYKFNDHVLILK